MRKNDTEKAQNKIRRPPKGVSLFFMLIKKRRIKYKREGCG